MDTPLYGLIGRGRVAAHLAHYLELEGCSMLRWNRGMSERPETALAEAEVILAAISDDALAEFFENHFIDTSRPRVHFSGSRTFPGLTGLHPLMTFGPELYKLKTYRSIPFVEDEGGLAFGTVFPGLVNRSWALPPSAKPLYHALCVLGGNFSTILWTKAMSDFEDRLGLPREILFPYLEQVSKNITASGERALTGSLARGDRETTAIDLKALAGDPFERIFQAFAALYERQEGSP